MKKTLAGYRDKISVRPGDTVRFMVHSGDGAAYQADLVRIIHGSGEEGSPGLVLEEIASDFAGEKPGQVQPLVSGSCAYVDADVSPEPLVDFSFGCAVYPTLRKGQPQCIASASSIALVRNADGKLALLAGRETALVLDTELPLGRWSFVGFAYCASEQRLELFQMPQGQGPADGVGISASEVSREGVDLAPIDPTELVFAARCESVAGKLRTGCHFNGRLDSPRLMGTALPREQITECIRREECDPSDADVVGFWDFATGIGRQEFQDLSAHRLHGRFKNLPTGAVTGFRWSGKNQDWKKAPWDYSAVHFHDDDIYDLEWEPSFSWTVPKGTRSGAYAARIRKGDETDYITVFVTPERSQKKAPVAFIASTATYLAYANETVTMRLQRVLYGRNETPTPEMQMLVDTPAFGFSHYDHHTDKSGIHYSSYLRPIMNLRPDVRMWSFNADTAILHWLEQGGWDYDLITDHDIHREGVSLLEGYQTLITGTHPEYLSTHMFDSFEAYLARGGRLMYMGGNGFYWRVGFSDAWPGAMEVRRAEDGTRAWIADPCEYYQAFDGQYGGLWRRNRRPPNQLVGVGFAAQGFDESRPYIRTAMADDPRAAFIFDGVPDQVIGDFGLRGGAAGGEEIDRFDPRLGSPAHALVVASAGDMPPDMLRVKEEFFSTQPLGPDKDVRADMTFFETPSGGAVFSTGSIAWAGSLCHNGYDNNVAKISANVLNRFISDRVFDFPR